MVALEAPDPIPQHNADDPEMWYRRFAFYVTGSSSEFFLESVAYSGGFLLCVVPSISSSQNRIDHLLYFVVLLLKATSWRMLVTLCSRRQMIRATPPSRNAQPGGREQQYEHATC